MRLRVTSGGGVVVGHQWRLYDEVFKVSDRLGQQFLEQHAGALAVVDDTAPAAPDVSEAPAEAETDAPMTCLRISKRVLDALQAGGIATVGALREAIARGDEAMRATPGIGPRALDELKRALAVQNQSADQDQGEGAA